MGRCTLFERQVRKGINVIGQGVLGVVVFLFAAWLLSENRWRVEKRVALMGLSLQVLLALLITQISVVREAFVSVSHGVEALKGATLEGTKFVFGYLGGGEVPFVLDTHSHVGTFIFALQALPMIMVVSALSMLLFHWNVLQVVVQAFSWVLHRTLKLGGALGVAAAAKVFFGNIEAPLLVRPYLKHMNRSELFTIMTCGMATTSATVMAVYSMILEHTIANPIAHILTASIISIPGAITISRLIVPQEGAPTPGKLVKPYQFTNWMDAISRGTIDGLSIVANISALLIVVLALVSLLNVVLGKFLPLYLGEALTLQTMLGVCMAPVTWLMGVPWSEALAAGKLLGTKTVLNEIIAFLDLAKLPQGALSPHSALIMMYGLCGFANFSSLGIVIGGMGTMVPERRDEIIGLGFKSIVAGTLATCLSGTIIGLLAHLGLISMY